MPDVGDPAGQAEPVRSRRRIIVAAVVGAAVAVGVLAWFEPHRLFVHERVVEAIPTVTEPTQVPRTTAPGAAPADEPTSTEPTDLAQGTFVSLDHGTSGQVRLLALADGARLLRLEDLATDSGPDLFVYLTTNPADGDERAFDDDLVNLGPLKGNLGDQNYEVPTDVDLDRYTTVVIWCDRFNSAFGAADLA